IDFGVNIFDMGYDEKGIVKMVGNEKGIKKNGKKIVCGEYKKEKNGEFGDIEVGIGKREVEKVLETQTIWQKKFIK
ncbi:hypothetical protein FE74_14285, partial [Staphylococcus aureus]